MSLFNPDFYPTPLMDKHAILSASSFGQRVAEEEIDQLTAYFVETDHWRRLYRGEIDVVYGAKGSGKSALYSLLLSRSSKLKDQRILLVPAESPRGTPAFRDLLLDPPTTEREFAIFGNSILRPSFTDYWSTTK